MSMQLARRQDQSSRTSPWLRGKGRLSVAAAVAVGGLAAFAATGIAQAATAGPAASRTLWNLAYQTHGGPDQIFNSITAPTKTDAWAVGSTMTGGSVFAHWNGHSWAAASIKGGGGLSAFSVYSTSPSNVWIFGEARKGIADEALVYNGSTWSVRAMPPPADMMTPALLGPNDVWMRYAETCPELGTGPACTWLVHSVGTTWPMVKIPGVLQADTTAAGHAWFFTLNGAHPALYEATGNKIAPVKAPAVKITAGTGIVASPGGQLWMLVTLASKGHREALYHWNGTAWKGSLVPATLCPPNAAGYCPLNLSSTLSYDGKGGFWSGWYAHWTGKQWVNAETSITTKLADAGFTNQGVSVAIPGTHSVWGVGEIDRTPDSTVTNGLIAIYGPLP